jgi:hypothetical protein
MVGGVAHADIILTPGNNPSGGEQTIQFEQQVTGQTSFSGDTNQTNTPIEFNLINGAPIGESTIGTDGKGQASIDCTGGCGTGGKGSQLTDLEIKIGSGFGATDFIGNLDFGEGTAQIVVNGQTSDAHDFPLGNGQNFFTLTATNGDVITDIQITEDATDANGNFGWNDFKQPRVSGICTVQGTSCSVVQILQVPEPSTLAIAGAGLCAAGWFLRRRKSR